MPRRLTQHQCSVSERLRYNFGENAMTGEWPCRNTVPFAVTVPRYMEHQSERPMRSIGYARVSTAHQDEAAQVAALREAGCSAVFSETVSSRTPDTGRLELQKTLEELQEGDELVLAKLDRLGRTQGEVINRLHDLQTRGIHVRTLDGLVHTLALGKMAPLVVGLLTGLATGMRSQRPRAVAGCQKHAVTGAAQFLGGQFSGNFFECGAVWCHRRVAFRKLNQAETSPTKPFPFVVAMPPGERHGRNLNLGDSNS